MSAQRRRVHLLQPPALTARNDPDKQQFGLHLPAEYLDAAGPGGIGTLQQVPRLFEAVHLDQPVGSHAGHGNSHIIAHVRAFGQREPLPGHVAQPFAATLQGIDLQLQPQRPAGEIVAPHGNKVVSVIGHAVYLQRHPVRYDNVCSRHEEHGQQRRPEYGHCHMCGDRNCRDRHHKVGRNASHAIQPVRELPVGC